MTGRRGRGGLELRHHDGNLVGSGCPPGCGPFVSPVVSKTQSAADVLQRVTVATQRAVARARNAILACGRSFLGQAGVLSHSFRKRAESFEPKRGPIPKVRARNRMLLRAMLARYSVFWAAYREALKTWRSGDRSVVFPFGTWGMRLFHSALVASE